MILEESVMDLEVDMDNVETANLLQDERVNTLEAEIFDNENNIEGQCQLAFGDGVSCHKGFSCLMRIPITSNLYISELVDTTTGLMGQVLSLEQDLSGLDQRVPDLEAGGNGSANITG